VVQIPRVTLRNRSECRFGGGESKEGVRARSEAVAPAKKMVLFAGCKPGGRFAQTKSLPGHSAATTLRTVLSAFQSGALSCSNIIDDKFEIILAGGFICAPVELIWPLLRAGGVPSDTRKSLHTRLHATEGENEVIGRHVDDFL